MSKVSINYNKEGKSYYVLYKRKVIASYSKNAYGHYAKKLAEMTAETKIRYKNYFRIKDNYSVLKIFSKKYGYFNVKIDTEDLEEIMKYRWKIAIMKTGIYCNTQSKQLHRLVMGVDDNDDDSYMVVDHKNHDTLDNRKNNLRKVEQKINLKNMKKRKTSNNPWIGVVKINRKNTKGYMVRYRDKNHIVHSKYFNINKYGKDVALKLAITESIKQRYKNDYILQDDDYTYIEENNINLS